MQTVAFIPRQPCALKQEGKWCVDLGFVREDIGDRFRYHVARDIVCNSIFPGLPSIEDVDEDGLRDLMVARFTQMIQDTLDPKSLKPHIANMSEELYNEMLQKHIVKSRAEVFLDDFETICQYLEYDVVKMRQKLIEMWAKGETDWDRRRPQVKRVRRETARCKRG
jgi:hypothetical protein